MGNFLFRTGSYRAAKRIERQQKKSNELLSQLVQQSAPAAGPVPAPAPVLGTDGRYYSADGRYVWDGQQWLLRA